MFPPDTTYDQAARYLLQQAEALLLYWLLGMGPGVVRFVRWKRTALTMPGQKDRVCDAVAHLVDTERGDAPVAALVEVQTAPDPSMFGRMLLAGGLCWLTLRPSDLPGDRFELLALVVNLTGTGDCSRRMVIGGGAAEWTLKAVEVNLSAFEAPPVLEQIVTKQAPMELLPLIPLLKNGCGPDTIARWLEIAALEKDLGKRGDFALAIVFAAAVGMASVWEKPLETFMISEPEIVTRWKGDAERKGKSDWLLLVMQSRPWNVPQEVQDKIRGCAETANLDSWLRVALSVATLDLFRQQTGL